MESLYILPILTKAFEGHFRSAANVIISVCTEISGIKVLEDQFMEVRYPALRFELTVIIFLLDFIFSWRAI